MYPEYSTWSDPSAPKQKATELEMIIDRLERMLQSAVEIRDRIQRFNMRLAPGGVPDEAAQCAERPSRTWLLGGINDLLDDIDRIQKSQSTEISVLSNLI